MSTSGVPMSYVDETGEWMNKKISVFGAVRSFVSSLRTGQDMTRLPMPAIFLRPYSILEVLASRHLGHVDLLCSVNKAEDAEERMLLVAAWYCSNLRQEMEMFYKKPYNPVHGEVNECFVEHPVYGKTEIYCEQVSHHPPITASLMVNKQEQLDAFFNYSFGVQYSGNSVNVSTSGTMTMRLNKREEEYQSSHGMPALLITNVIWGKRQIYWNGEVTMECAKTKLKVTFNFGPDPKTYVNVVNATLTKESDSTSLATLHGELGGVLEVTQRNKTRVLLDPVKQPRLKLLYPPKEKLDSMCSFVIWADTSKAIVEDDMDKADVAKKVVEDTQRERRAKNPNQPPKRFYYDENTKHYLPLKEGQVPSPVTPTANGHSNNNSRSSSAGNSTSNSPAPTRANP